MSIEFIYKCCDKGKHIAGIASRALQICVNCIWLVLGYLRQATCKIKNAFNVEFNLIEAFPPTEHNDINLLLNVR